MLSATNVWAKTTPIEPVLVPVVGQNQKIDIHMGKYEVTVAEFTRFANATGYKVQDECHLYNETHTPEKTHGSWDNPDLTNEPYLPVVCIGAEDAMAYAKWLSEKTGKAYRLPNFKEWQFAASAGKDSRFSFGDDLGVSEVCDYENIEDAANIAGLKLHHNVRYRGGADCNDGAIYHTVVGMYRPNDFDLHDMMGNVRELMQTCESYSKEQPEKCQSYQVAGSGWHWIAQPTNVKDSIPFIGSIEGFRLVLDSNKKQSMSKQTQHFIEGLMKAQDKAQVEHSRLKSLPKRVQGVRANLAKNKQVNLSWQTELDSNTTYAIYRSYIDKKGKISRKMTKVADQVKGGTYLDTLPGDGAASYQVFASNAVGESQPSAEASVGKHQVFSDGERIQTEFYSKNRNTHVLKEKDPHSILFSSNEGHYPPGLTPFVPAWLTFNFANKKAGVGELTLNARGANGAIIEFWQGNHLVSKVELKDAQKFVEITVPATLKTANEPLQIRQANRQFFVIDWFEFRNN